VGPAIDGIKFVGGSPHVLTRSSAVELVEIGHTRFVYVCESGLLQHALTQVRGLQRQTSKVALGALSWHGCTKELPFPAPCLCAVNRICS
jgi:hypothetical protein